MRFFDEGVTKVVAVEVVAAMVDVSGVVWVVDR